MNNLCADRGVRILKRDVARLTLQQVKEELYARRLNRIGDEICLRDRLLRGLLMENALIKDFVPWYEIDVEALAAGATLEAERSSRELFDAAEGRRRSGDAWQPHREEIMRTENERTDRQQRESMSTGGSCSGGQIQVQAMVHQPPSVVPVSSSLTTSTTTSTTVSHVSTFVMAAPILGKPISRGNVSVSALTAPRVTVSREIRGYWSQLPEQYEYFSAERVRGIRPAPREALHSTPVSVKPPPVTPARGTENRPAQEQWFTPSQRQEDFIEQVPESSRSSSDDEDFLRHPRQQDERPSRGSEQKLPQPLTGTASNIKRPQPKRTERGHREETIVETGGVQGDREVNERRGSSTSLRSHRTERSQLEGNSDTDFEILPPRRSRPSRERCAERDDEQAALPARSNHACRGPKADAATRLRSWGLRFSGESRNEDPEEFLEQLGDCRADARVTDGELFSALPCVFSKRALRWYRTARANFYYWEDLVSAFKRQFIGEYDREDLLEDLRKRTQAKGEPIANYLSSFNYIVSKFNVPPPERELVDRAWRNLLPEYRRAMSDKLIDTLEEMERYGRRWERQKDLDSRYVPPQPADRMRVPGAAYSTTSTKAKIAAAVDVDEREVAAAQEQPPRISKKVKNTQKQEGVARSAADTAATTVHAPQPQPQSSCASQCRCSFLDALQVTAPSNQPAATWNRQARRMFPPQRGVAQASWTNTQGAAPAPAAGRAPFFRGATRAAGAEPAPNGEFYGACFTCHSVGHRAADCPETQCFVCGGKGHRMRFCPQRRQQQEIRTEACQNCGTVGTTFKACIPCAPLRERMGNGQGGEQTR